MNYLQPPLYEILRNHVKGPRIPLIHMVEVDSTWMRGHLIGRVTHQRIRVLTADIGPLARLQIRNVRARDERLKRMGDLLSSIRLVKMYAWEKPHRERVEEARGDEMTAMFFINLLDGIIDSLYSAISSVVCCSIALSLPRRNFWSSRHVVLGFDAWDAQNSN